GRLDQRRVQMIVLPIVWEEHETPADFRGSEEIDHGTGRPLRRLGDRLRQIAQASIECSGSEAARYTLPVLLQELFRIATGMGNGKERETKFHGLLGDDLCVLSARDRHHDV